MEFVWRIEEHRRFRGWFLLPDITPFEKAEDAFMHLMSLENPRRILRITPVRNHG